MGATPRQTSVAAPRRAEVLRFCFFGEGRRSPFDLVTITGAWCFALAVLFFNALFPLLFSDGNLLIRGVVTLILSAPLLGIYVRGKRAVALQKRAGPAAPPGRRSMS